MSWLPKKKKTRKNSITRGLFTRLFFFCKSSLFFIILNWRNRFFGRSRGLRKKMNRNKNVECKISFPYRATSFFLKRHSFRDICNEGSQLNFKTFCKNISKNKLSREKKSLRRKKMLCLTSLLLFNFFFRRTLSLFIKWTHRMPEIVRKKISKIICF